MRVVYLGTPALAVIPLAALAADPRFEVVGVVTQPDRPAGRSGQPEPPPVKQAAVAHGIPVLQPDTLRDPAAVEALAAMRPDAGVVAAYGEILRKQVLAIPPLGYLNIHPSLLPRWRGPTPVAGAILAGDAETGVTVMRLDAQMDSGPILAQQRQPLAADARAGLLSDALFHIGAGLLCEALAAYAAGSLSAVAQDDAQATYTRLLRRADGQIDWMLPAAQIERMIRAYDPWPGAFTTWRGQPLRILSARAHAENQHAVQPGVLLSTRDTISVATGGGTLELIAVQPAGKRAMAAAEWARGLRGDSAQFV
ncbi:MAG: methionyl-tRNA formyltransferase [Roseiflexaceae bacterium]|nr:methionyl-tRNA formyltransferase [Roseiflexaceae bacterium]